MNLNITSFFGKSLFLFIFFLYSLPLLADNQWIEVGKTLHIGRSGRGRITYYYNSEIRYLRVTINRRSLHFPIENPDDTRNILEKITPYFPWTRRNLEKEKLALLLNRFLYLHNNNAFVYHFSFPNLTIPEKDQDWTDHAIRNSEPFTINSDDFFSDPLSITFPDQFSDFQLRVVSDKNSTITKFSLIAPNNPQLQILEESRNIIIQDKDSNTMFILRGDKLDPQKGGIISVFTIKDRFLDKKHFWTEQNKKGSWFISARSSNNGLIDLSDDANPEPDPRKPHFLDLIPGIGPITIPFRIIGEQIVNQTINILDTTIFSLVLNIGWWDPPETVRQKIIQSAIDKGMLNYLTQNEIEQIATAISQSHSVRFRPINSSFIISRLAVQMYGRLIVQKNIANLTETDDQSPLIISATDRTLKDLKTCLKKTDGQDSVDRCISMFSFSAPYRIGKEVIEIQISKNFASMIDNQLIFDTVNNQALQQYNRCMTERYFPFVLKSQNSNESITIVQTCIFTGILKGVELVADNLIHVNLSPYYPNPPTSNLEKLQKEQQKLNLTLKECLNKNAYTEEGVLIEEGIYEINIDYFQINYSTLDQIKAKKFKKIILECSDHTKIAAGERVANLALLSDDRINGIFSPGSKEHQDFIKKVIKYGYHRCVTAQKEKDPEGCRHFIELVAIKLAVDYSISQKLFNMAMQELEAFAHLETEDPERYEAIKKSIRDKYTAMNNNVQSVLSTCTDQVFDPIIRNISNGNNVTDQQRSAEMTQTVACAKKAITRTSFHIAGLKIKKMVDANQTLRKYWVTVSPQQILQGQKVVSQCFKKHLDKYQILTEIANDTILSQIEQSCSLEAGLFLVPQLVESVLHNLLRPFELDRVRRSTIVDPMIANFKQEIKSANSLDQLIGEKIDTFKIEAASNIILLITNSELKSRLSRAKVENIESTIALILKQMANEINDNLGIITNDPNNLQQALKQSLQNVMNSDNEEDFSNYLNQYQVRIARYAVPFILEAKLAEHLEAHIKKEQDRKEIQNYLQKKAILCFDSYDITSNPKKDADNWIKICGNKIAGEASYLISTERFKQETSKFFPPESTEGQEILAINQTLKSCIDSNSLELDDDFYFQKSSACIFLAIIDLTNNIAQRELGKYDQFVSDERRGKPAQQLGQCLQQVCHEIDQKLIEVSPTHAELLPLNQAFTYAHQNKLISMLNFLSFADSSKYKQKITSVLNGLPSTKILEFDWIIGKTKVCADKAEDEVMIDIASFFIYKIPQVRENQEIANDLLQIINPDLFKLIKSIKIENDLEESKTNSEHSSDSTSFTHLITKAVSIISTTINYDYSNFIKGLRSLKNDLEKLIADKKQQAIENGNTPTLLVSELMSLTLRQNILKTIIGAQLSDKLKDEFISKLHKLNQDDIYQLAQDELWFWDRDTFNEHWENDRSQAKEFLKTKLNKLGIYKYNRIHQTYNRLIDIITNITSASEMNTILASNLGKEVIEQAKRKLIVPYFYGGLSEDEQANAEEELRPFLADALLFDLSVGSFAERFVGEFIKQELDIQIYSLGPITGRLAVIWGYNLNDFEWWTLRPTPSGKEAIKYFVDNILYPYIRGQNLTPSEMSQHKTKLEELIKQAQDEN